MSGSLNVLKSIKSFVLRFFSTSAFILLPFAGLAVAQEASELPKQVADVVAELKVGADTLFVLISGFLVFFMHLGFAMIESGLCRAKNTVNILAKNVIVVAVSAIAFWLIGWGIMFGDGNWFMGTSGLWMVGGADNSPATGDAYRGVYSSIAWAGVPLWAKFFFQMVFCAVGATIVSGVVAERIKFSAFLIFAFIITAFLYPITGHWVWGGGWLSQLDKPMIDFAGSTVVHSVGGWAALAGVLILGPRIGKYGKDGSIHPIPGHSLTSAVIGTMVLWFGWFGFNPGSAMAVIPGDIARIAVTTNSAAAAAGITSALLAWFALKKPDLSMILNGILAGLVAITAPCAAVSVGGAVIIGIVAGVLAVYGIIFFDKMRIDDPVGALTVHLLNGIWGTIAVGLFAVDGGLFYGGGFAQLGSQLLGIVSIGAFTFIASLVVWLVIKATVGVRVSAEEEIEGLDIGEHGMSAYPDFTTASKQ